MLKDTLMPDIVKPAIGTPALALLKRLVPAVGAALALGMATLPSQGQAQVIMPPGPAPQRAIDYDAPMKAARTEGMIETNLKAIDDLVKDKPGMQAALLTSYNKALAMTCPFLTMKRVALENRGAPDGMGGLIQGGANGSIQYPMTIKVCNSVPPGAQNYAQANQMVRDLAAQVMQTADRAKETTPGISMLMSDVENKLYIWSESTLRAVKEHLHVSALEQKPTGSELAAIRTPVQPRPVAMTLPSRPGSFG